MGFIVPTQQSQSGDAQRMSPQLRHVNAWHFMLGKEIMELSGAESFSVLKRPSH